MSFGRQSIKGREVEEEENFLLKCFVSHLEESLASRIEGWRFP